MAVVCWWRSASMLQKMASKEVVFFRETMMNNSFLSCSVMMATPFKDSALFSSLFSKS
jgi:hypothetical protein